MILLYLYPLLAVIPAAIIDAKTMRIPNLITFPSIIAGITLTAVFNTGGLFQCVAALVALFLFGATGLVGLGDIKLLMVVASTCGIMFTIITIGIAAIALLMKELITDFKQTCSYIVQGLLLIISRSMSNTDKEGKKVPMAVYILIGYICAFTGRVFLYVT